MMINNPLYEQIYEMVIFNIETLNNYNLGKFFYIEYDLIKKILENPKNLELYDTIGKQIISTINKRYERYGLSFSNDLEQIILKLKNKYNY